MDKGIRPACNAKFVELLPQRAAMGNTAFRKEVMFYIMEEFGITLTSAATHYNHAFKEAKKVAELAEQLDGLGRPEDKKGGRKPKSLKVEPVAEVQQQTVFTVKRKSDDVVVAEAVSFEAAQELVQKAHVQKKAKLYWI